MSNNNNTSVKTKKVTTPEDVLLYKPNLIGYGRVICTICSFVMMMSNVGQRSSLLLFDSENLIWIIAIVLYLASFVGDLLDGIVARAYDQCSTYGGVLDMITDRCSTAGFLFILACEYSSNTNNHDPTIALLLRIAFVLLMVLDISSHWVQMYSSLTVVAGGAHHKSEEGNKNKNFLVRWFYKYYWFFGYLCVGAELTYILTYVQLKLPSHYVILRTLSGFVLNICIPGMIAKQAVNMAQLCSSCYAIAQHDANLKNK